MMRRGLTVIVVVFVFGGNSLCESPKGLVVVPVELGSGAKDVDAQVFYQGIIQALSDRDGIQFQERSLLKTIFAEQDLTLAIGPEQANKKYSRGMAQFEFLLVPSICRLRSDYMLSIRIVSVEQGLTIDCVVYTTRLASELANGGRKLVNRVLSTRNTLIEPAEHATTKKASQQNELRQACIKAKAQERFSALWQRVDAMREKSAPQAQLASYYYWLIQLSARAERPPKGMVFVPGGWVSWQGLEKKLVRKLWVEPFFIDRNEVSVEEYAYRWRSGKHPAITRPITAGIKGFNDPALPVTGVGFKAAEAFAKLTSRRLPTALQWLRAADYFKTSGCVNLLGSKDGYPRLAPARQDESAVNGFGGNVREWTRTWQARKLYEDSPSRSPREPESGTMKLICGLSWRTPASASLLSSARGGEGFDDVGFRCVRAFFFH